jgi:hypothetical protein
MEENSDLMQCAIFNFNNVSGENFLYVIVKRGWRFGQG